MSTLAQVQYLIDKLNEGVFAVDNYCVRENSSWLALAAEIETAVLNIHELYCNKVKCDTCPLGPVGSYWCKSKIHHLYGITNVIKEIRNTGLNPSHDVVRKCDSIADELKSFLNDVLDGYWSKRELTSSPASEEDKDTTTPEPTDIEPTAPEPTTSEPTTPRPTRTRTTYNADDILRD